MTTLIGSHPPIHTLEDRHGTQSYDHGVALQLQGHKAVEGSQQRAKCDAADDGDNDRHIVNGHHLGYQHGCNRHLITDGKIASAADHDDHDCRRDDRDVDVLNQNICQVKR